MSIGSLVLQNSLYQQYSEFVECHLAQAFVFLYVNSDGVFFNGFSTQSTLADRFLQVTGAVSEEVLRDHAQFLDSNPVERDRKITIKARAARMNWNGYILNLIDCPG